MAPTNVTKKPHIAPSVALSLVPLYGGGWNVNSKSVFFDSLAKYALLGKMSDYKKYFA